MNEITTEVKNALEQARLKLESSIPKNAVIVGDELYDKIFTQVNQLKRAFKDQPEVIGVLESLATFYLDCGYKFFHENRNATTTVDKMLNLASITLRGVAHSDKLKNAMENAYRDWHWHGW